MCWCCTKQTRKWLNGSRIIRGQKSHYSMENRFFKPQKWSFLFKSTSSKTDTKFHNEHIPTSIFWFSLYTTEKNLFQTKIIRIIEMHVFRPLKTNISIYRITASPYYIPFSTDFHLTMHTTMWIFPIWPLKKNTFCFP